MRLTHSKTTGFTLLEVLIAISIFAVIGLGAYRMLDMIILSQTKVESHTEALRKTERAMQLISTDFEQLVNRPIRDNYADKLAAVLSPQNDYLIEFTRQGWRNPLQLPRSQLQRVAYELGNISDDERDSGTHLLRHYWNVLDRAQDTEPRTQVLLKNVDDIQIRFLGSEGDWHSEWPAKLASGKTTLGLPSAVVLEIHTNELGQIQRLFQFSEASQWGNTGIQGELVSTEDEDSSEADSEDNTSSSNDEDEDFDDDVYDDDDDDYDPDDYGYDPSLDDDNDDAYYDDYDEYNDAL